MTSPGAMPQFVRSCPKIMNLLVRFCDAPDDAQQMRVEMIDTAAVPEPYRGLLVHEFDMTSTLTEYHDEPISLRVLDQQVTSSVLRRHVVLEGMDSGRPLEYGASQIQLAALSESARREVVAGQVPLGGILNTLKVQYASCPGGCFRVRPGLTVIEALGLEERSAPDWLYGRCNCLTTGTGNTIAEVVEILPPEEAT